MFCSCELNTHMTELAQYADTLLDQQNWQSEESQIATTGLRGWKLLRLGADVTSVEGTEVATIRNRSMNVVKKDHAPTEEFETTSNEQFKHCLLCQAKGHNMDKCKLAAKKLAALRDENTQRWYGNRRKSPGARDRNIAKFSGCLQYQNCVDRQRSLHASKEATEVLQQQHLERPSHLATSQQGNASPKV